VSRQEQQPPAPGTGPQQQAARPVTGSFLRDLRVVWAERGFRRLLSTRLVSQAGDGLFTAGLGGYVFFNSTNFPNPASGAAAFAVLYLPYSVIGPFAGVFIDRWSRRQILVRSALIRAALVVVAASLVASGQLGIPLYLGVLAVLGVNRFFLSSLSASMPHVVPEDKLVMANSVAPTAGGLMAVLTGVAGLAVHGLVHGGRGEYAATLLAAGCCYVLAGLVSLSMGRDSLGPSRDADRPPARRVGVELASVAAGLVTGARYVLQHRGPATALGATACNRFMYGILFLMSLLLYRNYFYRAAGANAALKHYTVLAAAAGVGYGLAALVTPHATRWLSKRSWIALMLASSAVITGTLGAQYVQTTFVLMAFALGIAGQGIAICATTILQEQVPDGYRGRVFAFYDMSFNASYVGGAVISIWLMPMTGKSVLLIALVAIGYAVSAAGYVLLSRQSSSAGPSGLPGPAGGSAGGTSSPADAAQARSS
jgi:MFS family permease